MRHKLGACLALSALLSPCLHASETDPREVIEALRVQMKQLKTIEAEYTVDSIEGPSRKPMKSRVTYVKDSDRYSIVENQTDPNGREGLRRTVYDGIEVKVFVQVRNEPGRSRGIILPADHKDVVFTSDDLLRAAGFSRVAPGSDERFSTFAFEDRGTEMIDGRECQRIVFVSPYPSGQRAFNYDWVETDGSRHILRRVACLIDDRPDQLLYEHRYSYDSSGGYPFPTEIVYRRYDIDSQGKRTLEYDKRFRIEQVRINEPVDPCELAFTFPEGTIVNVAPPTVSAAELRNPDPARLPEKEESPFDPNLTQPDPRTEFRFPRGQIPLFLPVRFGPRTYDFLLDTGCTGTVFDLSFRPLLGRPKRAMGMSSPGNPLVVQAFAAPRAFVGPFDLADCNEVVCANLKSFTPILGREVHGILGMDILRTHVVQIDFDQGRIAFLDDGREGHSDWGWELPITFNQMKMPQIKVVVGDQPEQDFTIDTGAGGSGAVTKDLFERLLAKGDSRTADTAVATGAGVIHSRDVRSGRATVGPLEYQGLIFTEGNSNRLGLDFLSRHVVTFDFPRRRLYLKKGADFDKPDETGMSGVSLVRSEGRTVVYAVYEGQPAAKAGIKVGDVLLKLQGRDTSTHAMWEIRDLLRSGDGKEITVTIQRGDQVMDVAVVLERQI